MRINIFWSRSIVGGESLISKKVSGNLNQHEPAHSI